MSSTITPSPAPAVIPEAQKTWMPVAAGILTIVAGAFGLIAGLFIGIMWIMGELEYFTWFGVFSVPFCILGVVSIIGGIFALLRKVWGMALAGAICAIMYPNTILGIVATIFVALSKKEFK